MALPGPCTPRLFHLQVFFVLFSLACSSNAYFANWGDIGRAQEPTCVDIPKNMSLCSNIQYERMRLPNLLAHDTLTEVAHQSSSWVPLLNVRCHPDTQLFLCSLFTPVCLERPIFPCRSLCVAVQTACEKRMTTYGYHWPDMLRCENFPEDNDMCLKAQHTQETGPEQLQTGVVASGCEVCNPVPTYENILDHFCRADFVLRLRIKALRHNNLIARKARVYKPALPSTASAVDPSNIRLQRRALRKPHLLLEEEASCCSDALPSQPSTTRYLIMGKNTTQGLVPTFVLPWSRSKSLREAVRVFEGLDCSDPSLFTPDTQSGAILNTGTGRRGGRNRGRGRRGRGNKRRKGNRRDQEAGTDPEDPAADSTAANEVEETGNRRGGARGSNRRRGGGRNGRRNGRRREEQSSDDETSARNNRRERQKRRKEERKNGRGRSGDQSQRLGEEEKERRKQFIRRKMEQSRMEVNSMDESGANI